ncbi:MAG: polysaccharide pyruvyl transferase family protein [Bacteroidaceae bacterium]|nr:polysaccharide pyruvyl transferase family protein [Bacteroidaceae bacterium]
MKIGLLTYYGDLNCGTNMQAYATLQALKKEYPSDEVEIIPFHGFKPSIRPYKTFSPKNLINDIRRIRKYSKFVKEHLQVKNDVIIKDVEAALEYINSRKYDVIYVGADTLLELDRVSDNCISAYWLKDVNAKKILIAASAKNVVFEKLTEKQQTDLKIAAGQFAYVGVRDRVTMALFERLLGNDKKIEYIPDPTFTYHIDYSYIDTYLRKKNVVIPEKSVFVQFYGDDYWLDDVAKDLKKRGYTMITNRGIWWSDIVLIDMSPLEQVGLYKYVSFVITHRFHDGVFCMKNHTPALIYVKSGKEFMTEYGESKHVSLLKDFGLYPQAFLGTLDSEEGLADVWQSFQNVKAIFDEEKIEGILQQNEERYLEYLDVTTK